MGVDIEESGKDYSEAIKLVKKQLKDNGKLPTPKIAEKTKEEADHTWKTWRYHMIPGILDYLHKEGEVEKDKVHEGGEPTHYWRLSEA